MSDWTEAPLRDACWRVPMVAGIPRAVFWVLVLSSVLAGGLVGIWVSPWVIPPLTVAVMALMDVIRRACLADPAALSVWGRWVFEPAHVTSRGRFDRRCRVQRLGSR